MRARALTALSTTVGGLGLGTAAGYMALVFASFDPRGAPITKFMVGATDGTPGWGFMLVAIPYVLLIAHLWIRLRMGRWLLETEDLDAVDRYAAKRTRPNLMRARKEALANVVALMRVDLRRGDYASALQRAQNATRLPGRGEELAAFHRWRLEAALRAEDLIVAKQIVADAWPIRGPRAASAPFCACAAELAVRNRDRAVFDDWIERAEYADASHPRLTVAKLFAAARFGADQVEVDPDADVHVWTVDVPGARAEIRAVRAQIRHAAEDDAYVLDLDDEDRQHMDMRSSHIVQSLGGFDA